MNNNDILRRIRYMFYYNDVKMIALFKLAGLDVDRPTITNWLKKEEDPKFVEITDKQLATFLNGFIIEKRGKREGPQPEPENPLTNNMILRKLKIALDLKTEDILALFESIDKGITKNELTDFFRKPGHKLYRLCLDQYLRNFLNALQSKYDAIAAANPVAKPSGK